MKSLEKLRQEAVEQAERALRLVPVEAILYLRNACVEGLFDGDSYDKSFYGLLAVGSGVTLRPPFLKNTLTHFWLQRCLRRGFFRNNALDDYLSKVVLGDVAISCQALAMVVMLCDKVLKDRGFIPPECLLKKMELRTLAFVPQDTLTVCA